MIRIFSFKPSETTIWFFLEQFISYNFLRDYTEIQYNNEIK